MSIPLLQIFLLFSKLSIQSIGGLMSILPEMENAIVNKNHWLSHHEFMQFYFLAQMAPGPNMVIFSMLGYKLHGISGLITAFLAIYGPAFLFISILFLLVQKLKNNFILMRLELAIRPAILGLTIGSFLKIGFELTQNLCCWSKIFL